MQGILIAQNFGVRQWVIWPENALAQGQGGLKINGPNHKICPSWNALINPLAGHEDKAEKPCFAKGQDLCFLEIDGIERGSIRRLSHKNKI